MNDDERLYIVEEQHPNTGQWKRIGDHILGKETANIMAHHERDGRMRIRPHSCRPYTLESYAGDDASELRRKWQEAGSPDYSGDDG